MTFSSVHASPAGETSLQQPEAPSRTNPQMPIRTRILRSARWIIWRFRFLLSFLLFGTLSIAIEVCLVEAVFPERWPLLVRSLLGFVAGLLFAFYMNARFNFRVRREYFVRTFFVFTAVSIFSYTANLSAAKFVPIMLDHYPISRFFTAGCLFLIAYTLHRRFTFRKTTRNLGLAIYPTNGEEIQSAYHKVGDQFDHLHVDIVDSTFSPNAASVDLALVDQIRHTWTWQPLCLHVMSRQPLHWVESCWDSFDWLLIHIDVEDDVMEIIARCREHGRKIGVVWHHTITLSDLMPFLPHVDFVVVLGIEKPGHSGQSIMPEAIRMAEVFAKMANRYSFEVMFDGGVTPKNVHKVPARYLVSNSSVLRSESPIASALTLMSGGEHGAK